MSQMLASRPTSSPDISLSAATTGALAAQPGVDRGIAPAAVRAGVRGVDYLALVLSGAFAFFFHLGNDEELIAQYVALVLGLPLIALLIFDALGCYRVDGLVHVGRRLGRLAAGWAAATALLLATAFFFKAGTEFSRGFVGLWLGGGIFSLALARIAVAHVMRRWTAEGRLDRRAVVVGGGESAAQLIRALENSRSAHIRIVGLFDDRGSERSGIVAHYPQLGSIDDLVGFARSHRVDMLIVALPVTAEGRLLQLLKKLWVLPVDIRISALASRLRFRPRAYSWIGDVPFLDLFDRPLSGSDVITKAVFDRLVGALALIALSPVMLLTALAIKLDSKGPVLFRQKRYGFNDELVEVFKFRSMYVEQQDANAVRLVTKGDPRVTRVGRFIRKTSLDELPQLFNVVFKGNLSLVGPRPHAVHAKAADTLYQNVVDGYSARHRVKPGITGWAQINGWRGETDTPEKIQRRVECDLEYIERWSPIFDLYILAMTPVTLLTKSENAY